MQQLTTKKTIQLLFGFAVSLGLIYYIFTATKWDQVGAEIAQMRYWILIPALVVIALHFLVRAIRWRYLLPDQSGEASLLELFDAIMVGNFATYILPLRAGEVVRPFMLSRTTSYSFSTSFASVVIERFFDLATVLLTFPIVLFAVDGLEPWVFVGSKALGVLALVIVCFITACAVKPEQLIKLCRQPLQIIPDRFRGGLEQFLSDFVNAASVLSSPKRLAMTIALSIAVWLLCYLYFYVSLFLFTDDGTVTLAVSAAVIVALAVAAPSAPGFVGVYQVGCIAAFKLFGLSVELATAYAIVTHLLQYILYITYGVYALAKHDLNLGALRQTSR